MVNKIGLLVVLCTLFRALPVYSSESAEFTLNMGILELAPYAYAAKDGATKGYMVEMVREIREAVNFPGQDDVLPIKRLHQELKSGSVDCTIMARVLYNEDRYDMLAPLGKHIESVLVYKLGVDIHSYDDLAGLLIAVPNGVNLDARFDKDDSLNKVATSGYLQTTKMLQRGRIDAMLGVWDSYLFNMKNIGMSRKEIGGRFVFNKVPLWLMCRRDFQNEPVKERLIDTIEILRTRGVFEEIISRYLGELK